MNRPMPIAPDNHCYSTYTLVEGTMVLHCEEPFAKHRMLMTSNGAVRDHHDGHLVWLTEEEDKH